MTHEEFAVLFINTKKAEFKAKNLNFKGVHSVISGFNDEFRTLFGNDAMSKDERKMLPITAVNILEGQGKLVSVPAARGAMLYLPGDAPEIKPKKTKEDIMRKYGITYMVPPPVIPPAA